MEEQQEMKQLLQDSVFQNFYKISQIPRGSYHEEQISDYMVQWAKERGLFVIQDSLKNVYIRKEASKGYEQKKGVILQAHMDMVCEKIPESVHDFLKDPIPWVLEGDILSTGGETTLGADNGIGMALAMSVLEETSWKHPMIEVVFTVAEEETMEGAEKFDASLLQSSFFINLDHAVGTEIVCGSCGGEAVEVNLNACWNDISSDQIVYCLEIGGLKGGHSGEDIHRGNGNANRILARILMELEKQMEIQLCSLKGGNFRLAISREARCDCVIPKNKEAQAKKIIQEILKNLKQEYQSAGKDLYIRFEPCKKHFDKACSMDCFLSLILFSPDGIWEMNADITGAVNSSDNLGEMYLSQDGYRVVYEIRSAYDSVRDHIADIIIRLGKMLGGSIKIHSSYPGWAYHADSLLRNTALQVFEETYSMTPKVHSVHAGLECGCFFMGKPDLDVISIGPDCWNLHSPEERLSVSSTKRLYQILKKIIKKISDQKI